MKRLKLILLALCIGGLTTSLIFATISNSVVVSSPIIITENSKLPEFQYTLSQAKKAGYPKTVALIENEDYLKALNQLDSEFQKEPIEGYKKGFFSEALKAICLEKTEYIIDAYRAYQNARYYSDEENVRIKSLEMPKLEVYLGIGRMCNIAGRYYDSLNYLDIVRMEAAEHPLMAILADKELLLRAIGINSSKEVFELYKDLLRQYKLAQKRKLNLDNYKLTKLEYREIAEALFDTRNNNLAFKLLIEGLNEFGFDNNPKNLDLLFECFLNNILKAQSKDIEAFSSVLDQYIYLNQAVKGIEQNLLFLIHVQKIFNETYDYLIVRDYVKITNTCKENLAQKKPKTRDWKNRNSKKDQLVKKNNLIYDQNLKVKIDKNHIFEDLIMSADIIQKNNRGAFSKVYYDLLKYCTGEVVNLSYDGSISSNALLYGIYKSKTNRAKKVITYNENILGQNYRDAYLLGVLYVNTLTNKIELANKIESLNLINTDDISVCLLECYQTILRYILNNGDFELFNKLEVPRFCWNLPELYDIKTCISINQGCLTDAVELQLDKFIYAIPLKSGSFSIDKIWAWGTSDQISRFKHLYNIKNKIIKIYPKQYTFGASYLSMQHAIKNELEFEKTLKSENIEEIKKISGNILLTGRQYGGFQRYIQYLNAVGLTNLTHKYEKRDKEFIRKIKDRLRRNFY